MALTDVNEEFKNCNSTQEVVILLYIPFKMTQRSHVKSETLTCLLDQSSATLFFFSHVARSGTGGVHVRVR